MPYIVDQNAPKYGGKNQGKIPLFILISVLFIFFHLIFGFLKLVMISLPLLLTSSTIHQSPFGT
jgi:hypothetical protein